MTDRQPQASVTVPSNDRGARWFWRDRRGATQGSGLRSLVWLGLGVTASLVFAWLTVRGGSFRPWLFSDQYQVGFTDLHARIVEVAKARGGGDIYVPFGIEAFTYPPAAILLFFPLTLTSQQVAYFAWTWLSILCLAGTYFVVLRSVRQLGRRVALAVAIWAALVTVVLFPPMAESLAWGQTSTILLLLVTVDFLVLRRPYQGALVGLACALKLYPGMIVVFWLFRRKVHTACLAVAAGVLATGGAWLLWPHSASTFFFQILPKGSETSHFSSVATAIKSASASSFFLRMSFLPETLAIVLGLLAGLLIVVAGLVVAVRLDRLGLPITALVIVLCLSVVVSPVAWDHYFTFAPLLVFAILEVGFRSLLARASMVALLLFAFPWFLFRYPSGFTSSDGALAVVQNAGVLLARNAFFMASVLVIAAAWAHGVAVVRSGQPTGLSWTGSRPRSTRRGRDGAVPAPLTSKS
jgi:alpha-1,2-mannosyltransferase